MSKENSIRSKIIECVIWPDSTRYDYNDVLEKVKHLECEYAYILHDNDVFSESDCTDSSQIGQPKKPHFHIIMRFDNQRYLSAVYPELGVTFNSLQVKGVFKKSIQYLVHFNHPHKFQYSVKDIVSNIDLDKYFTVTDSECRDIPIIIQAIKDNDICTVTELMSYCASHNLYASYRRSQASFIKVINEHIKDKFFYEQQIYKHKIEYSVDESNFKARHNFDVVRDDSLDFGM